MPFLDVSAIKLQIKHGPYPRSHLYGNGNTGVNIAEVLGSSLEISLQKQLKTSKYLQKIEVGNKEVKVLSDKQYESAKNALS